MRKPAFCICENKDADQLHGNCAADQRFCFRYNNLKIVQSLCSTKTDNSVIEFSAKLMIILCRCVFSHDVPNIFSPYFSCNVLTGACQCKPGYHGDKCRDKCEMPFYGQDCGELCIDICPHGECDHITGECKQCYSGTAINYDNTSM